MFHVKHFPFCLMLSVISEVIDILFINRQIPGNIIMIKRINIGVEGDISCYSTHMHI
jgi:hypothetical protein